MVYDFEHYFNRPSSCGRGRYPSYYSSYYTPSYGSYLHDRYYYLNGCYTPWYRSPSTYARTRAYLPYRPSYDYKYDIPEYTPYYTYPRSARTVYPEAEKYDYTYGLNFDSTARDIRSSTFKLLQDVRRSVPRSGSVPRFVRASSLEPSYNSNEEYYRSKRSVSRTRMMSEEPSFFSSSYSSQFY